MSIIIKIGTCFLNFIYIFIGEFIVLIIGVFLFKILEKNHGFMEKYIL